METSNETQGGIIETKAQRNQRIDAYMEKRRAELLEKSSQEKAEQKKREKPEWYDDYVKKIHEEDVDLLSLVRRFSEMSIEEISKEIGGNLSDLNYDTLKTLLSEGSENAEVAQLLRDKRTTFLKESGQLPQIEGIVAYDGRVIPMKDWLSATDSEKRAILVGSTCFHYNSGTPGMDSNPTDRY